MDLDAEILVLLWFTLAFALLGGGFGGLFAAMLLFGSGLLWAPFAALLAYREASHQGLASRRYAVLGSAYSILCIFLWLNLMAGMRKGNWNYYKTYPLYIVLYLIWCGLILMVLFIILTAYIDPDGEYYRRISPSGMGICVSMVVAWSVSAIRFCKRRKSILAKWGPSIPLDGLLPFGLALLSTIAIIVYDATGYGGAGGILPWTGRR